MWYLPLDCQMKYKSLVFHQFNFCPLLFTFISMPRHQTDCCSCEHEHAIVVNDLSSAPKWPDSAFSCSVWSMNGRLVNKIKCCYRLSSIIHTVWIDTVLRIRKINYEHNLRSSLNETQNRQQYNSKMTSSSHPTLITNNWRAFYE